jgi:LysM repeat protein
MRKVLPAVLALSLLVLLALPAGISAESLKTPGGSGCAQFYTIQRGDTLGKIARAFGTTVGYLASLNGITDPNRIVAGATICVKEQLPQPTGFFYRVKQGDTLYSIARKFGWSVFYLAQANCIVKPHEIYAGRMLWIPAH